jgi:hypothetical protein
MDETEFRMQVVEALARLIESLGDIEALLRNIDANVSDTRDAVLSSG